MSLRRSAHSYALLCQVGAGSERLYAAELNRLSLLLRPERTAAARLVARGISPHSLSSALGVWDAHAAAALPVSTLLPILRSALMGLPASMEDASTCWPNPSTHLPNPSASSQPEHLSLRPEHTCLAVRMRA